VDVRYRNYLSCISQQGLVSIIEKLDGCSAVIGDDHPCGMKGISTIHIKMFDGMVRELKEVRYVTQLKMNLISVGALKILGLELSIKDGVLRMIRGSMVVLKGVRHNNLYYLKGGTITGQVDISTNSDDDCTRLWHTRLGHEREKSLQALAK